MINPSGRVAIIGAGNVGASIAYALINEEISREVLMLDISVDMAKAQVLDMEDATNFTRGTNIKYGEYTDLTDGDIVIVTCGAAQKEGQTRMDLLKINVSIIRSVLKNIQETGKKVFICMVTNPVDVLTHVAIKESGMPEGMVFGSGTNLDTARLKILLKNKIDINPENINAYILGEHGDTSFPVLSSSNIGGVSLQKFLDLNHELSNTLMQQVRDKAYEIILGKKSTYYGIGASVSDICRAIIKNENRIFPLSYLVSGKYGLEDVTLSVPVKLSSKGVEAIPEIELNDAEKQLLLESAKVIKDNVQEV